MKYVRRNAFVEVASIESLAVQLFPDNLEIIATHTEYGKLCKIAGRSSQIEIKASSRSSLELVDGRRAPLFARHNLVYSKVEFEEPSAKSRHSS